MHYLNSFILLLASIFVAHLSSAASFESKVSEVVLYKNKARETRQIAITTKEKGRQEWVLTNIPHGIDPASLQVGVIGANLITASTSMNYLAPNPSSERIMIWQDSLEKAEDQMIWIREQMAVFKGEIKLLEEIIKVDGDETSMYAKTTADLLDLFRNRSLKVRETSIDLMKKEKVLERQINDLKQQISQAGGGQTRAVQEIKLIVDVKQPGKVQVKCSYLVNGPGWTPAYNLRSLGLQQPVLIEMIAVIHQNTGFDWEDVQLSLSTSDPSANQLRPVMTPLYIDFHRGDRIELTIPSSFDIQNMAYAPNASKNKQESIAVEEDTQYSIDLLESPVAQTYIISRSQTIRTGSEAFQLPISSMSANAEMKYHAVPKKDLTAFLIARIPQWEQYDLLQGSASIFFEDNYVGTTVINPKVASDTLLLSMGRDELIQIDRTSVKDVTSTKWLGGSKKEMKVYEIIVRNNKKSDISIEVLDQIPVSRQKDIEVVLESFDGAEYSAENGRLKWLLDLKPGEVKKLRFSYSCKYPGDRQVVLGN